MLCILPPFNSGRAMLIAIALTSIFNGYPVYAHSCRLILLGKPGWELVTVRGHAVVSSTRVGYLGTYGIRGAVLAVAKDGHLALWNIQSGKRLATFGLPKTLRLPMLMAGFMHDIVLAGDHGVFFTAVDTLSPTLQDFRLIHFDTRIGTVVGNIAIPRVNYVLANAVPTPKGMALSCGYSSKPRRTAALIVSLPEMKFAKLNNAVPSGGGVVFINRYGLLAWGASLEKGMVIDVVKLGKLFYNSKHYWPCAKQCSLAEHLPWPSRCCVSKTQQDLPPGGGECTDLPP